ncbi:hypothetical protein Agub_g8406 [Astrephomene gubernaculifera]|uniref:Uncharacterized protein n=1 Tax=Astrephomene gubernaculifera TaxID=47775 RepID=A0AAD3HN22_9CHLO|nr:hypothetical protein Agub_g8406 [Astrephomene gubernaculifera]
MSRIRAWLVALFQWFSRCFSTRKQYTDAIPTASPGAKAASIPRSEDFVKHDQEAPIPAGLPTPSSQAGSEQHTTGSVREVAPLLPQIAQQLQAVDYQVPEQPGNEQFQASPAPQQQRQQQPPVQAPIPLTPLHQLPQVAQQQPEIAPQQQHQPVPLTPQQRQQQPATQAPPAHIPLTPLYQTPHAAQQLPEITPISSKLQQTAERQALRDITPYASQVARTPSCSATDGVTPGSEYETPSAAPPTQQFRRYMVDSGKVVGVNNTVTRYREAKPIMPHTTPFPLRVDRELELEGRALGANVKT